MRAISEIAKIFRKEKPQEEDKKITANQIWGIIDKITEEKHSVAFQVARKIDKDELPSDLREWKYYDEIGDAFGILVSRNNDGQHIRVTTGTHHLTLTIKEPNDTQPTIKQGRAIGQGDFPIESDLGQDDLNFAHDLARFVWVHWARDHPPIPLKTDL